MIKNKKSFTLSQVRHLATNFTIHCLKGYDKSFDEWYTKISPDWIKIANRKEKLKKL